MNEQSKVAALNADSEPVAFNAALAEPFNVLIVGVGGQGVIMVSKVLAALAQAHGFEVKQSEVHGMAKRGGAVFSHVRFGQRVWSPTIPKGEADVLIALEWAEGLRWLPHLKRETGVFICDTKRIVPPFACLNRRLGAPLRYSTETAEQVSAYVSEAYAIDATRMAEELGNDRAANVVLLGALSTVLEFALPEWEKTVTSFVPKKTIAVNSAAFELGRNWIAEAKTAPPADDAAARPAPVHAHYAARLEITDAWCKSCEICVKLCPERCLTLNADRIVEMTAPEKCTGCRLCEWLCPDFAIRVHLDTDAAVMEAAR
ncbi:pyruvate ferredoxin/flavodoxin oxidoreductase [Rhodopseudomonas palustris HaA2]|uniref:Pyruvate ferredoxin/flavodoxin oxidoreductase n=1 Tax=Rhodopseudomonas palustris (strain HaA2) TaxID=316058 RepID=Q2J0R7_RHOP2|nr:2-oxoacid:acceptor oxidoreductase family protein [Rhodopseudomonas palustris]ABD05943.1 pyruvate ferredoxin/flavodoxin oxidoreductase [Rhodopseudomonas palustris HaA2]